MLHSRRRFPWLVKYEDTVWLFFKKKFDTVWLYAWIASRWLSIMKKFYKFLFSSMFFSKFQKRKKKPNLEFKENKRNKQLNFLSHQDWWFSITDIQTLNPTVPDITRTMPPNGTKEKNTKYKWERERQSKNWRIWTEIRLPLRKSMNISEFTTHFT